MIRLLNTFLAGVLVLTSFTLPAQEKTVNSPKTIIILHVNDMHSKIDNMAKLAYLADSLRALHPYVFLVSAGDNFTGNPVVDMVPEKGYPMIDLMNRCGFDVSALGNHEFDMGQAMLKKRMMQAKFPFICANMDGHESVMGQLRPIKVLEAGSDVSIALLGLIQLDDNGLPSAHPSNMKDITFENGMKKAREFMWLKEKHQVVIALSHLGLDDDMLLADSLPVLDAIIGGHSHTVLEQPRYANNVMITQTGANMRYVGKMTLEVLDGKVTDRKDTLILFSSLSGENRGVKAIIDMVNNNQEFNKVAGAAEKPLEGPDELGSMMADALTSQLQVDLAFQNRGGIRISSLPAGNITLKDVYKLDPFNNQVVIFSMTTDEIRSLICYGYEREHEIDLQVSGMTYRITTDSTGQCCSVEMFDLTGNPLDPKKEYSVALSNYVAYTYKFIHRDKGTPSKMTTSEALIKFLGTAGRVDYYGVKRATMAR